MGHFRYNAMMPTMTPFATALLDWYDRHGRRDLPWHRSRDAYAIWVSEIMLQQTQVAMVIPYYVRFMARFPTLQALAAADQDHVLHIWTGLGYYSRARHLHRAAQHVCEGHAGRFPADIEAVCALPGIGRSTAGAILAFAFDQRHAILDGNVKRVLARYHRVDGDTRRRAVDSRLWALADQHTPHARVADYTQAIMDLGATICRRTPHCAACPVAKDCAAYQTANPIDYPKHKARRALPQKSVAMLLIRNQVGQVLLQKRPPVGVWGGLWSFPECQVDEDVTGWCRRELALEIDAARPWCPIRHTFSHYHLDITPVPARLVKALSVVMGGDESVWYNPACPDARGLAAPVTRLIDALRNCQ